MMHRRGTSATKGRITVGGRREAGGFKRLIKHLIKHSPHAFAWKQGHGFKQWLVLSIAHGKIIFMWGSYMGYWGQSCAFFYSWAPRIYHPISSHLSVNGVVEFHAQGLLLFPARWFPHRMHIHPWGMASIPYHEPFTPLGKEGT